MNFRNQKTCNGKGKWEKRREQSGGDLGGCVRLCVEELTAMAPRIAEGKKKQRIVLLQNTKAS